MRTLRGRLALFYGLLLVGVLGAFAATVWAIIEAQEATEPPEVAALEGPDPTGRRLLIALGLALPVAAAAAAAGAVLVSRRALAPLDDVVATAARIKADQLSDRISEKPDTVEEVAVLVRALNDMLARLERSVGGMRRFTADASHELRTPLAALLANLELALRRPRTADELRTTVETTLEELQRLQRLVEALLTLARSDAGGLPAAPVAIDLSPLAAQAVETYRPLFDGNGVALTLEDGAARAHADPMWVRQVVATLLDNAAKLTPRGGTVTVRVLGPNDSDSVAAIEVRDTGPGVTAADRERIFERFYRGQAARARSDGSGLGLALGRELARGMGGDLTLLDSASGAAFRLVLPVTAESPSPVVQSITDR